MEAHVEHSVSQTYRLKEHLAAAQVRHGEEVRADLLNIGVASPMHPAFAPGSAIAYFCNMGRITVRERLTPGDDEPMPMRVVLENLAVQESGPYDLINAKIISNGDIRIIVDEKTVVQYRGAPRVQPPIVTRADFERLMGMLDERGVRVTGVVDG